MTPDTKRKIRSMLDANRRPDIIAIRLGLTLQDVLDYQAGREANREKVSAKFRQLGEEITEDQIAEATAKIREGWSERTHRHRAGIEVLQVTACQVTWIGTE